MKPQTGQSLQLSETLEALRQEIAQLGQRVAKLEAAVGASIPAPAPAAPSGEQPVQGEGLSEEVLVVISAAIAAFLGKKAPIRQIRLLGTTAWAQQGRVTIQASHALSARHTRSAP